MLPITPLSILPAPARAGVMPHWLDFEARVLADNFGGHEEFTVWGGAFLAHCLADPDSPAVLACPQQFKSRLGQVVDALLIHGNCTCDAFLGALTLKMAGVLNGVPMPRPFSDLHENWAHYLARHGRLPVSAEGLRGDEIIPLSERFIMLADAGFNLSHEGGPVPSPLSVALEEGNWESLAAMLEAGAEPQPNNDGERFIHRAIERRDPDALVVLLNHANEHDFTDVLGRSPFHAAVDADWPEAINILMENFHGRVGAQKIAEIVNAQDRLGRTAAHYAAEAGDLRALASLCRAPGIELARPDNAGGTPLHLAVREERMESVGFLLKKGAPVNAKGEEGWTPLHEATANNDRTMIETLLAAGADIHARSDLGESPIALAVELESTDALQALLAAPPRRRTVRFESLHEAVSVGRVDEVKRLLRAKADVNARNEKGETPLLVALRRDQGEVAALLLEAGASTRLGLPHTVPILVAAAMQGATRVLRALLHLRVPTREHIDEAMFAAEQLGHTDIRALLFAARQES